MHKLILLYLILPLALLSGCDLLEPSASADQTATVQAFKYASEKCVHDVRDGKQKYESSSNCNSLGALSFQYMKVGGGMSGAPNETELEYRSALANAWMARAISLSDGGPYNIW